MTATATLVGMAKQKKPTGGKHVQKRGATAISEVWMKVVRRMAKERGQPLNWYLIKLVHADATEYGLSDLPRVPWDQEGDE